MDQWDGPTTRHLISHEYSVKRKLCEPLCNSEIAMPGAHKMERRMRERHADCEKQNSERQRTKRKAMLGASISGCSITSDINALLSDRKDLSHHNALRSVCHVKRSRQSVDHLSVCKAPQMAGCQCYRIAGPGTESIGTSK